MRIEKNLQEMKADELLVLPTLTWDTDEHAEEELSLRRMGFLISAYEPAYWFFEVVDAARKILLISLLPSLTTENATSFLWGSFLLSFAALLLTGSLRPYGTSSHQSMRMGRTHVGAHVCAHAHGFDRAAEPQCDRLMNYSLTVTCITIFYGTAIT